MDSHRTEQDWNNWLAANASRFLLFARQQTRCGQDAEDVLQEALVEAWKRVGGQPDNALVYATIRRRSIDLGRRSKRREAREQASEPPQFVITNPDDEDATRLLETELKRLPPQQRDVLTLKFWGGLTFAEVATTLEIPQGTAASRYRMALESLRQTLTTMLT